MLGAMLSRMLGRGQGRDELLPLAIDRVVAATDARLALLPGYRKALTPGMKISLAYVESLTDQFQDDLDLSLRAFTLDRRLGLFFSSPASLLALLRKNQPLQDFFHSASNGEDAYALLLMQRSHSLRFGVANQDGAIISDVAQTVVSFDHHRLMLPCPSREALRLSSPRRGLDLLATVIARRLALLEQERSGAERDLARIRMRLSVLANPGSVLIDAMAPDETLPQGREALLQRQSELQQRLVELRSLAELSGILEQVSQMLAHPQEYLRVEPLALYLDRMGVVQEGAAAQEATMVSVEEVQLGPGHAVRRVVLPVHVSLDAIRELEQCVAADG